MTAKLTPAHARLAATWEHPGTLLALCVDAAGERLLVAGSDWNIYAIPLADLARPDASPGDSGASDKPGESVRKIENATLLAAHHENYVSAIVCTEKYLISAGYDRQIVWADLQTGQRLRAVEGHDGWTRDLVLFAGGAMLASVGDDMTLAVWETESGKLVRRCAGHDELTPEGFLSALYAVTASGDGKLLATGDRVGRIVLWDATTGDEVARLNAATFYTYDASKRSRSIGGIRSLAFSPDGAKLAASGIGQVTNVDGFVGPCRVEVFDCPSGQRTFVGQDGHNAVLNDLTFHGDASQLIGAGGGDGGAIIAFWDQQQETPVHKLKPKGHVQRLRIDPARPRMYLAGFGGLQVWDFDQPQDQE